MRERWRLEEKRKSNKLEEKGKEDGEREAKGTSTALENI